MNNVVVAYISVTSFRALPRLQAVLGADFKPSGTFYESTFADDVAAGRARDELFAIGRWGPDDDVVVESSDPRQLDIREAYRLASSHDTWRSVVGDPDSVEAGSCRLRIVTLRRCVTVWVGPPAFTIGGGAGFLVDHEHRIVLQRSHHQIADVLTGDGVLTSTVGEFASRLQR
jgi:hypothetical protein